MKNHLNIAHLLRAPRVLHHTPLRGVSKDPSWRSKGISGKTSDTIRQL